MGVRREVLYVDKGNTTNAAERIISIGGINALGNKWKMSQQAAIIGLESDTWEYMVKKGDKVLKVIIARDNNGNKYLKTDEDGEQPESLLNLPAFPVN